MRNVYNGVFGRTNSTDAQCFVVCGLRYAVTTHMCENMVSRCVLFFAESIVADVFALKRQRCAHAPPVVCCPRDSRSYVFPSPVGFSCGPSEPTQYGTSKNNAGGLNLLHLHLIGFLEIYMMYLCILRKTCTRMYIYTSVSFRTILTKQH